MDFRIVIVKLLEYFYSFGVLIDEGKFFDLIGMRMVWFFLEFMYVKVMFIFCEMGCFEEMFVIVFMMLVDFVFYVLCDKF